ncbi:type II toxin-antitoxin system HicA family toxin [Methylocystis sp. IM3]|uniref:type II toxin-antitoxin system HicA family toxin n=1 Tax=unclassified Methylocystis TaxID=2625913 RepID=UPI00311A6E81
MHGRFRQGRAQDGAGELFAGAVSDGIPLPSRTGGWSLLRVSGSHHVFRNPKTGPIISLSHPKKDLGSGLVWTIYKAAGWPKD